MKQVRKLDAEIYQRALNYVQRSKVSVAGSARFREPLAQLAGFFNRRDAAGAGQGERYQSIWRAMRDECSLQRCLFAQIEG